jgi:simple sugar transport system ATP-binding protein
MTTPIIECRGLQKWYSGVHALKNVNLTILPGEVVGLVGDNGAGKSTLIKILSGVHRQDAGEVLIEGKPADIRTPKDAMRYGLETIYQYNSMVPTMSIARNLFIGREPMKWSIGGFGVMDQKRMRGKRQGHRRCRPASALAGCVGRRIVRRPEAGRRDSARHAFQVEGADPRRADQPSVGEGNRQGHWLRKRAEGAGLTGIFISHNMHHVFQSCDRIVAMARGEIVFDRPATETTIDEVHELL